MKIQIAIALVFIGLMISANLPAQNTTRIDTTQNDISIKEYRKQQRRLARKNMTQHFSIGFDAMFAFLNSSARLEGVNGIFSAKIALEKHLGLENQKMIYSLNAIYRITPRSGFYAFYYQLNRKKDHMLTRDIAILGDTIKKGILAGGYLNTSIFSFGYLFSILTEQKAFLGMYANIYVADIKVGVRSDVIGIQRSARYYAAVPNFGILASFEIKKWFTLAGSAGLFFMNAEDWSGTFHDIHLRAEFNLAKWIGISLGYNVIDVSARFPEEYFTAYVDYNYKGPSAGLRLRF